MPGLWGRIDYIHKLNLPGLFTVSCDALDETLPYGYVWRPSHLTQTYENSRLRYEEKKFITWRDVAVSCQWWVNKSDQPLELRLSLWDGLFGAGGRAGSFQPPEYTFAIAGRFAAKGAFEEGNILVIPPQGSIGFALAAALSLRRKKTCWRSACRKR